MSEPFEDVDFPDQYPARSIAEHEVLMSFTNDKDAALFRDWWELWGKHLFGGYIESVRAQKPVAGRKSVPGRKEMYAILKARSEELKSRWYNDE